MDVDPVEDRAPQPSPGWLRNTNHNPDVIAFIRRARQLLPGDPEFGDPLSAADRLMPDPDAATREISLGALQVWQAITERVSGKPANAEVTLVFTDLVGFSNWSLRVGDDATLKLLRRVAQVAEPPLLGAGGHIVKRMGDGMMAVFADPLIALTATIAAREAVRTVEVEGFTPRIRAGIHTGRPQRIGSDWLGVDVNIAARVMERATRGGLIVSEATLDRIPPEALAVMGVAARRVRKQMFAQRQAGVPPDLAMYRIKTRPDIPGEDDQDDGQAS